MPIVYTRLLKIFEERGINSYTIKKNKVIGQAAYKSITHGESITMKTIEKLCEYLNCQPGDILEYIPDPKK